MSQHAQQFEQHRDLMFSIAYRMLGTVSDAEDVLQEAFLRWQETPLDAVRSARSLLSTIVTRLCIDHLRSARARREQYIGPWLPEPLVSDASQSAASDEELSESLSMAFLMMLESLSPPERAAFLLHDVFGFDFEEVGRQIGKTSVNSRQICNRARKRLRETEFRFEPDPQKAEQIASEFIAACKTGDLDSLVSMMADDVALYSDGGGKVLAARRPIEGRKHVARFLVGVVRKGISTVQIKPAIVNGRPGVVARDVEGHLRVFSLDFDHTGLRTICVVGNPDKLRHLRDPTPGEFAPEQNN